MVVEEDKNEVRGQWEQVIDKEPNEHKLWTKGERAFNKMVRNLLQRVSDTALLWECATPLAPKTFKSLEFLEGNTFIFKLDATFKTS